MRTRIALLGEIEAPAERPKGGWRMSRNGWTALLWAATIGAAFAIGGTTGRVKEPEIRSSNPATGAQTKKRGV